MSSHVLLFMNTDPNSALTKQRDTKLCSSTFVQYEDHDKFCQNIRCEQRQKNEDGIWIHVSLFCPVQGKDLGQHS